MAPPIQFGLGLSLARAGGAALDADAKAYIAAVETAGATVSGGQKAAIDTFYKTGKSDGWYSSLKRIYLPIWGVAAPNAIDMMELGSGTFNGTVTHGAGFVQGDGTTGYFDTGTNAVALGGASGNASLFALVKSYTSVIEQGLIGAVTSGIGQGNQLRLQTTNFNFVHPTIAGNVSIAASTGGIHVGSATSTSNRFSLRRGSSGVTSTAQTTTETTSLLSINIYAMCRNLILATPNSFSTAELGAYGAGISLSIQDATDFTLALKNLWEGTTGLTLV
jgi:hypothetical protein